jgi:hypothetical protein
MKKQLSLFLLGLFACTSMFGMNNNQENNRSLISLHDSLQFNNNSTMRLINKIRRNIRVQANIRLRNQSLRDLFNDQNIVEELFQEANRYNYPILDLKLHEEAPLF